MRVLFDYQCFIQTHGGISRYHCELIRNFPAEVKSIIPCILSDNVYLRALNVKHLSLLPQYQSVRKENLYKALNMALCATSIKQNTYDIFHPTFLNPYYIGKTTRPTVVTIHDLTHEKFPDAFIKADIVKKKRRKCIEDANAIICISEETKRDLQHFYNVPNEKITVIYHGTDQCLFVSNNQSLYKKPYLLYIGKRAGYKNFDRFLKAYSLLNIDIDLVCTGNGFNHEELQNIYTLGVENRIHHIFATNSQMNDLLYHAVAFVYPSLGEGFGLPILEAFRCDCPCIVSNLSCFHEVAGDAAIYFDPLSVDEIFFALQKTLSNNNLLDELRTLGRKRLKLFTWNKTSQKTIELYKNLL